MGFAAANSYSWQPQPPLKRPYTSGSPLQVPGRKIVFQQSNVLLIALVIGLLPTQKPCRGFRPAHTRRTSRWQKGLGVALKRLQLHLKIVFPECLFPAPERPELGCGGRRCLFGAVRSGSRLSGFLQSPARIGPSRSQPANSRALVEMRDRVRSCAGIAGRTSRSPDKQVSHSHEVIDRQRQRSSSNAFRFSAIAFTSRAIGIR